MFSIITFFSQFLVFFCAGLNSFLSDLKFQLFFVSTEKMIFCFSIALETSMQMWNNEWSIAICGYEAIYFLKRIYNYWYLYSFSDTLGTSNLVFYAEPLLGVCSGFHRELALTINSPANPFCRTL